ncbi:hypothetical protein ANOM_010797 [Aspergillus nomiae NRRL 13137]|uniref:Fe2OG dioxygenase domain-containing protein n=1 Tax=Aspergillus nomiae NRRL (strain ATCC 15546 / NRRL 13137 / CBS 260.88 / M93) TaxID=1509407 RepID=A0A0L1IM60_ASPN3|nr:uncharacterized protein ANOM_010797 [Aspergillus nomiae NRRL 13137]KNG80654.1 hypothetical protein ANOM_010797 [Aspergillus nomiae NRRL 13137]
MGSIQPPGQKIAKLPTIAYRHLLDNDPAEVARLLSVCVEEGFFYLDMRDHSTLLAERDKIYDFMANWFSKSDEVKEKYARGSHIDGYKPVGAFAGPYQNTRDSYESLKVSHKILADPSANFPEEVEADRDLFSSYLQHSREVSLKLISALSDAMNLPSAERLENFHQSGVESNSVLVLLKYPYTDPAQQGNQIGHNKHTDIGSITFLFTDQWGLQVMAQESTEWEFIEPRPGHAVINVGDSLRFLSKKVLRSCLHRVIPVPGQEIDRYTIAYFLRPSDHAIFKDSNNETVSAAYWHDRKYEVFQSTQDEQSRDTILTGGLEPVGTSHEPRS